MLYYDHEALYIFSKTKAAERVAAIDNIIDTLLITVMSSVQKGNIQEYMLNDGQTIIKTVYRNPDEVTRVVERLYKLRNLIAQDINSRSVRLVDAKNILSAWAR